MTLPNQLRGAACCRWLAGVVLCALLAVSGVAQSPDAGATQAVPAAPAGTVGHPAEATPGKRQVHEAEEAYLEGAKRLEHDDLTGAEAQFQRALKLNPQNRNYAIAISVARQHELTELVREATQARRAGDAHKADTLMAEARAMDPDNPVVTEHSGSFGAGAQSGGGSGGAVASAQTAQPWRIQGPVIAGAIQISPDSAVKSHHLSGPASEVIRNVALAYGIKAVVDDSVEQKSLRFNLENVDYSRAMAVVLSMAHAFSTPVDEKTVVVAKDDADNRRKLERQLEETIYMPGLSTDQINELAQVVKSVFDVRQSSIQTGLGSIVVRAPQEVLEPLNETLKDLMDPSGEVMVDVKLYEVSTTGLINAGVTLPTQFGVFNVDAAATQLVNANQTLVQQGIAQGLILPTDSNLVIAGKLLASGLVQSSLLTNLLGTFGGGILTTGLTQTGGVTFNLGQNSSDSRALDDLELRVGDRQAATFREGNKYPITQSTYTTGLSTAASSALSGASINGVPVSTLLQQYAGGSSATIPQVTYEDLGVTLKATPAIEKSGRINLLLDLKIEALSGTSLGGNPVLESRQFASDLTVADGESALMVSNVTKSESAAMTGLPGLSELPGFQLPLQDSVQKSTDQLVVVVTPHVVRRRSDMVAGPRIPTRAIAEN